MHLFAIGDIHGRADRLSALLARLFALDPAAGLVFLGDYIDRGAQTRQVLDTLIALRAVRPETVFLMGNHEAVLSRYAESRDLEELRGLRGMGFQATLDSYPGASGKRGLDFMPGPHREFLGGLTRWHRSPGYAFFHAPLPYGTDPDRADALTLENLLSSRALDRLGWEGSGQTLVFGHMPFKTPLVCAGLIGLDTGAGYGRMLTALELPELRFHHA